MNGIFSISFAVFIKMEDEKSVLSSKKESESIRREGYWGEGGGRCLFFSLQLEGFSFYQLLNYSMER